MNEMLLSGETRFEILGRLVKRMIWSAAGQVALYGLCPWDVDESWVLLSQRDMALPGLGAGLEGTRLCHLSDLHCSPLLRERHLIKYFEMVNRLEPDFVLITGDFITASSRHYVRRMGKLLQYLSPKVETLAVLGNHDYGLFVPNQKTVRGLGEYVADQLTAGGAKVLTNEALTFRRDGAVVHFAGIGEFWSDQYNPAAAFASLNPREPIVAMVHNPDAAPQLAELGARYVLAGHTHGRPTRNTPVHNVLWPAVFLNFVAGEYDLGDHRKLYVNRGIGPSRRVCHNTRPEVTLFTLRRAVPQVRPSRPSDVPAEVNPAVAASQWQGRACPLPREPQPV